VPGAIDSRRYRELRLRRRCRKLFSLNLVGDDLQRGVLSRPYGSVLHIAVKQDTKLWNFRDPAPVCFLLKLDGEFHEGAAAKLATLAAL